jgi:hypothetical protein
LEKSTRYEVLHYVVKKKRNRRKCGRIVKGTGEKMEEEKYNTRK